MKTTWLQTESVFKTEHKNGNIRKAETGSEAIFLHAEMTKGNKYFNENDIAAQRQPFRSFYPSCLANTGGFQKWNTHTHTH